MYLLDTNIVSELRRQRPHGAVLAWFATVQDADIRLPAVVVGELQAGIEMTRETDRDRAQELQVWLDQVERAYNVLPMDGRAFRVWARMMHRKSDTLMEDAMIAAVAEAHNLTVVTRNVRDFAGFGVRTLNPFLHGQRR